MSTATNDQTSQDLLDVLHEAGGKWGPLGVAYAAAQQLGDDGVRALIQRLTGEPNPGRNEFWPQFEQRFIELDATLDDASKRMYERAEAEARRDELGRAWVLVRRVLDR